MVIIWLMQNQRGRHSLSWKTTLLQANPKKLAFVTHIKLFSMDNINLIFVEPPVGVTSLLWEEFRGEFCFLDLCYRSKNKIK